MRARALSGVVVGLVYFAGAVARGSLAPALVGGVLAAVLTYLVLTRFAEQQRRRQRRRKP